MSALTTAGPSARGADDSVAVLLRDLIQTKTGIYFEQDRLDLLKEKLTPRLAACGCASYLDYFYILKYEEKGAAEWLRVMDAFSVQETYFWREADQIKTLVGHVVPEWFKQSNRPLKIWSAACATGEEPYTIALALLEHGWGDHPIEIIASDASEIALTKARRAVYRERSFRTLPAELKAKYFTHVEDGWRLDPALQARVSFHWANLLNLEAFTALGAVDVIFCRNVFIYFAPETIKAVVNDFSNRLPPEGKLFVGASESLLNLTKRFDLTEHGGAFMYVNQRKN